ncbi:multidrug efflux system CmeABC, inner membrane drug transporter CmeB [Campylobacter sp. RM5004]|uniref:efflux RND transporter permease subunit n=1 Tax=Campylobacter sp. RM5004 TaxID=1660078 RepID=UPI001EFBFBFE|nr:multidrug efflux RND transporter permease subunit [Campylobacter sp. RM5004]ULO01806.1 multidrug efflux system CmeABC, inner membrane drug transporter CmeB [Campylobacter sp. RM5004]
MFSKFFIYRPVFAIVVSIIITIAGILGMKGLPIEEYPNVTSPTIKVSASYSGVDAATLSQNVASILEDAINGVEDMIYITSSSSSSGLMLMNVYFKVGTDPSQALIDVNNRVQSVSAKMPEEVKKLGVNVSESSSSILAVVSIYSPDESRDEIYLSNYATLNIADELSRIDGVGDVSVVGSKDYSMRIWLDSRKLNKYDLTPAAVSAAIREQNSQYPTGSMGDLPLKEVSPFVYSMSAKGKLSKVSDFENIIIKALPNGNILYLKDIARVEIGSKNYGFTGLNNGKKMVPLMINLKSGANAIAVAQAVNDKLKELSAFFPSGIAYDMPYDTTEFVKDSINEVVQTFVEAILLVLIVMYMFLKNLRATIIPLIAVPVSLLGTFAFLYLFGFTINLITLFALVLAIGIVVDDAIVVVENVERVFRSGITKDVREATKIAMDEVTGPVISIVLVLSAVFIPVSFLDGFVGQIQRQFAITLVISVCISGFVALTLTPALCGLLLKDHEDKPFYLIKKFNDFFDWSTGLFGAAVAKVLRHVIPSLIVVAIFFYGIFALLKIIPSSLVPSEDKGAILVLSQLKSASSLEKTINFNNKIYNMVKENPAVESMISLNGFDVESSALSTSAGISFITLKDFKDRKDLGINGDSQNLANTWMKNMWLDPDGFAFFLNPPPIMGLSLTGGFEMYVQNKSGKSYEEIKKDIDVLLAEASKRPELTQARTTLSTDYPELKVSVDEKKAKILGLSLSDIYTNLNLIFGSVYVNDFTALGKNFQVNVRGDEDFRNKKSSLENIYVKNNEGNSISLASVVDIKPSVAPFSVTRFNLFPAVKVTASPAAGYTSGDAIAAIVDVFNKTMNKDEYSYAWAGSSYEEVNSSGSGSTAFALGMVFVFLILAAQYERWLMPLAVITAVPFAVFGSLAATYLRGIDNDIYFQIGLLLLIGLSAKNAILIVEFAMEEKYKHGLNTKDAAIKAAKLRFRPIIMTSLAFGIGILPLVFSEGSGSAARHALSTGLVGGIIVASSVSILFVPLFFYMLESFNDFLKRKKGKTNE